MISLRFATTEHPMSSHDQRGLSQLARYAQSWRNYIHFGCNVPVELVELIEYRERIRNEIADYIQTEAPKCATRIELTMLLRQYGLDPESPSGLDYDFFLPVAKDDADRWLNDINDAILTICEYRINRETKRVSHPDCGQHLTAATLGLISLANRLNAKRLATLPLVQEEEPTPLPSIPSETLSLEGTDPNSPFRLEPESSRAEWRNLPCASFSAESSEQGTSSLPSTTSKQPSKKVRRLHRDAANRKQNQENKSRDQQHAKKFVKQRPSRAATANALPSLSPPKRAAS
jgi:hypothetical protein